MKHAQKPAERIALSGTPPYYQVRVNEDGTLDEVVAGDFGWSPGAGKRRGIRRQRGVNVHLEQMDSDHWWLGVGLPDGRLLHVDFWTESRRANRRGRAIKAKAEFR